MAEIQIESLISFNVFITDDLKGEPRRAILLKDVIITKISRNRDIHFTAFCDDPVLPHEDKKVVTGSFKLNKDGLTGKVTFDDDLLSKIADGKFWYGST